MRVMVTGADGYIGSGVVKELLETGHEVIGFGLGEMGLTAPLFTKVRGDVFEFTASDISDIRPDAVVHLAWRNGFSHRNPSHIEDLPGHYCFVRRCVEAGVPRLAVMGSMHEVGYHEGAVCADTPCWPTTPYAVAKNALRELALSECEGGGTSLVWMRGFYLVSADGRGDSIFSKIVHASREGKDTFPFTSGKASTISSITGTSVGCQLPSRSRGPFPAWSTSAQAPTFPSPTEWRDSSLRTASASASSTAPFQTARTTLRRSGAMRGLWPGSRPHLGLMANGR